MAITDPSTAEQIAELECQRTTFIDALRAPNTHSGYKYDQRAFRAWAGELGLECLPTSPDTLGLYVTAMLARGLKVTTCRRRVSAVAAMHKGSGYVSPFTTEVQELLRGARRLLVESRRQALPLAVAELRAVCLVLLADDRPVAVRNWAIMMTGFAAALRNASTAALRLDDVEFVERGAILKIGRSKTDQEGRGHLIGLQYSKHPETCPVAALRKWIDRRGGFPGPLFTRFDGHEPRERGLLPERIGQIVQESIRRAGMDNPLFSGHSLRAGFVTEAAQCGAGELAIAATTGHRDMSTLRKYFRRRDAFAGNVCGLMDL